MNSWATMTETTARPTAMRKPDRIGGTEDGNTTCQRISRRRAPSERATSIIPLSVCCAPLRAFMITGNTELRNTNTEADTVPTPNNRMRIGRMATMGVDQKTYTQGPVILSSGGTRPMMRPAKAPKRQDAIKPANNGISVIQRAVARDPSWVRRTKASATLVGEGRNSGLASDATTHHTARSSPKDNPLSLIHI